MATDQTYTQVKHAFQAVAGITAMESTDDWFFKNSLNRAAFRAWSESEIWPRYLVRNEERCVVPFSTYNVIPLTETGLDNIAEFHRIFTADPFTSGSSALEVQFVVDDNGARVVNPTSSVGDSVWVDYKKEWDGPYDEDSTTIPQEFTDFIIQSILSDFYSGDGQTDKSLIHEQRASQSLDLQLSRLSYTNRNPYRFGTYKTHTNHQRRY